jgi:hypothetical protein
VNGSGSWVLGLGILLLMSIASAAYVHIRADDVYFAWNNAAIGLETDATNLTSCSLGVNGAVKLSGFSLVNNTTVIIDFNSSTNQVNLQCNNGNVTLADSKIIYWMQYPTALWLTMLMPLVAVSDMVLVLPAIPIIFLQSLPAYYVNDVSFIFYCIGVTIYSVKYVLETLKPKGGPPG